MIHGVLQPGLYVQWAIRYPDGKVIERPLTWHAWVHVTCPEEPEQPRREPCASCGLEHAGEC